MDNMWGTTRWEIQFEFPKLMRAVKEVNPATVNELKETDKWDELLLFEKQFERELLATYLRSWNEKGIAIEFTNGSFDEIEELKSKLNRNRPQLEVFGIQRCLIICLPGHLSKERFEMEVKGSFEIDNWVQIVF